MKTIETIGREREFSALEAAKELDIDLNRLYILLRTERIRGHKIDGEWRIPIAAIEARKAQVAQRS